MTPPPEYHDAAGHPLALGDFVAFVPTPAPGASYYEVVGRLAGAKHRIGKTFRWYVAWGYRNGSPLVEDQQGNLLRWLDPTTVPASVRMYLYGSYVQFGKETTWGTSPLYPPTPPTPPTP